MNLEDRLLIKDDNNNAYGGNQEWYASNTKAYAGCGSVACANMLRILCGKYPEVFSLSSGNLKAAMKPDIDKTEYVCFMQSIYRRMFVYEVPVLRRIYDKFRRNNNPIKYIPPSLGMSISGFIRGTLRYARMNGLLLHVHSKPTGFLSYDNGLEFIKEGIDKAGSVVLLTSLNKHSLRLFGDYTLSEQTGYDTKGMKKHFALITGIIERENDVPLIKLSTWGKAGTVPYDELNKSWKSIKAFTSCMYYFLPVKSKTVVRADMRHAPVVFLRAILSGVLRRNI